MGSSFFVLAAGINALAYVAWLFMNPWRRLKAILPAAFKARIVFFVLLMAVVVAALIYTKFYL